VREKKTRPLEKLLSQDGSQIRAEREGLVAARKELVGRLIEITANVENRVKKPASVHSAIFVLGEMRAVEAIEVLVGHIGFPLVREPCPPWYPARGAGMGQSYGHLREAGRAYPAAAALIKIGEPCLEAVTEKLGSTDDVVHEHACLAVLVGLREVAVVEEMLKRAAEKETDTKKKKRFQLSLQTLVRMTKEDKPR